MLPDERDVGGLRCSEVLERLSGYRDGELSPADVARVEAHVAACDNCARFGAWFSEVVNTAREHLAAADPLAPDIASRLRARLAREPRTP